MDKSKSILKPIEGKISLKVEEKFDPKEFFQKRKGLYIWSDFNTRITDKAESKKKGDSFLVASFELKEDANDELIEENLPKEHNFSESDVCAIIAQLISKQSKGEVGALLNNGNWNLFYTPAFVVGVGWSDFYGGWDVDAWSRSGNQWSASSRVFSPAI